MIEQPEISVIVPYGYYSPDLASSLHSVPMSSDYVEIILVTSPSLRDKLDPMILDRCKIIVSEKQGRGYFCSEGAKVANGRILLFLHADTTLPENWYTKISVTMSDSRVSGGGFSTHFRSKHWYLRYIPKLYNLFAVLVSEFWGDRALFMRKKDLSPNLKQIEIPIMEDVEMSRIMRKHGKLVLLADTVSTSEIHFSVKGYFKHTFEVFIFRCLYAFGVSAHHIHKWYYRRFFT